MVLEKSGNPLRLSEMPVPDPGTGQVVLKVHTCGVCRTDLHVVDGELADPKLPLIPGHEIVGTVLSVGKAVTKFKKGDRVGVPWLGYTCGECTYCKLGMENLCDNARFTGYDIDGGYAEYTVADERYCFSIPKGFSDPEASPLLCAGLIGYRSFVMTGEAMRIGMYGFGAAAHILVQVAKFKGRSIYAFTKPGDKNGQKFALGLGAIWAGDSTSVPPHELDAAIIFAPVGSLVPAALRAVT
jgi:propanol-preferring alcohol dehydrogenase